MNSHSNAHWFQTIVYFLLHFLQGTREQWQLCFLMSALMYLVGWLSYMIFAKSDVQEWAKTDNNSSDIVLEVRINFHSFIICNIRLYKLLVFRLKITSTILRRQQHMLTYVLAKEYSLNVRLHICRTGQQQYPMFKICSV